MRGLNIILFVCLTSWISSTSVAGPDDDELMGRPTFAKNGQLFTVQFTPAAHRIDVKMVGNEVAHVTPEEYTILAKAFPRAGEQRILPLELHESHYHIKAPVQPDEKIEIEVQNKKTKASETFRFDGKTK